MLPKILCICALFAFLVGCISSADAKLLKATITHSEFLKPIEDDLAPGHTFDKARYNTKPQRLNFYEIPNWLAGKWQYDSTVTTSVQDYLKNTTQDKPSSVMDRGTDYFGHIQDAKGLFWNGDFTPFIASSDLGSDSIYFLTREYYPVENTDKRITFRVVSLNVRVDKQTQKIRESSETESLQTYTPQIGNQVRIDKSQKTFDRNGRALNLVICYANMRKIGPYQPPNNPEIFLLFNKFLSTRGK
jgi:hypothetical protein